MCDYSLRAEFQRQARKGDRLVLTCERGYAVRFVSIDNTDCTICLAGGTQVAFDRHVEYWRYFLFRRRSAEKTATFRQIQIGRKQYDVIELADGTIIELRQLEWGQHVSVLQLPPPVRAEKGQRVDAVA